MAFTTYFYLSKPAQATQRYDLELNLNADIIEAALLGFPSAYPPGDPENYPDVTPTNGMQWLDTGNHKLKIYYAGSWQEIVTLTP
jgi:hypothetical protein